METLTKDPTHVKTYDLFYAAYLLASGSKLHAVGVSSDGARRVAFEFQSPRIRQLNQAYLSGEARVNLKALKASLHHLKDLIFKETTH